jgi:hypothetical protein
MKLVKVADGGDTFARDFPRVYLGGATKEIFLRRASWIIS